MRHILFVLGAFALSGAMDAQAGTIVNGNWTPQGCGSEPVAPQLDTTSSGGYSESLHWVELYQKDISAYSDCIVREANADTGTISSTVKDEQHRVKDIFSRYEADSKAAMARFGGKKQ